MAKLQARVLPEHRKKRGACGRCAARDAGLSLSCALTLAVFVF